MADTRARIKLSAAKLRRIALAQQGLLNTRSLSAETGKDGVAAAIAHLGYVQIDTISVVERAHHHVLRTRVKNYKSEYLDAAVEHKQVFEYWFHAAAYLPMCDFRFALPRMNSIRAGEKHWFENIDQKLLRSVYRRIETEGALKARDFVDTQTTNTGWWDWKPAKQAIEKLFMQGDLMVVGREGFQKRYDLTERVLPSGVNTKSPDIAEQAQYLIDTTLRAHGFASLRSFTYLRKGKALRMAVRECIDAYVESDQVALICSPHGDEFYCDTALIDINKKPGGNVRLLSPFDNLVIQRERCREIFDFDYQIECYVPAAKRQYGYFCLPILYKDRLVGRVDCKADRKAQVLHVKNLHLERNAHHEKSIDVFLFLLADALKRFMQCNACTSIAVKRADSKTIKRQLQQHLADISG